MNGGSVIDGIVSCASIANSVWLNGICDFGFLEKLTGKMEFGKRGIDSDKRLHLNSPNLWKK